MCSNEGRNATRIALVMQTTRALAVIPERKAYLGTEMSRGPDESSTEREKLG